MQGSNPLEGSHRRPLDFCPICLRKLQIAIGFNIAEIQDLSELDGGGSESNIQTRGGLCISSKTYNLHISCGLCQVVYFRAVQGPDPPNAKSAKDFSHGHGGEHVGGAVPLHTSTHTQLDDVELGGEETERGEQSEQRIENEVALSEDRKV
ncbi:hypothetical protein FQN60_003339 [Etheostoma spectabile]|uniref:Uncharacterized protein n=1 Tax=Etheostoma spectabile TaxID=54343 RepID=A0A5J5CIL1_9PERO|nr:hypothetical protein FQN60_003339 [Etheostoma spectabile]